MTNYYSKIIKGDFDIISEIILASMENKGLGQVNELNLQKNLAELFGASFGKYKVFSITGPLQERTNNLEIDFCRTSMTNKIVIQELNSNLVLVLTGEAKDPTKFYWTKQNDLKRIITTLNNQY